MSAERLFAMFVQAAGLIGAGIIVADILNIVSSVDKTSTMQRQLQDDITQLIR